ncbi:hypothetical protein ACEWPM_015765 [Roseovarius sp. S4756]|uniref:hypothetical protein n=1 Tax=Roseovarius maritimus TaxID=3342637 RepID=UPI003727A05E
MHFKFWFFGMAYEGSDAPSVAAMTDAQMKTAQTVAAIEVKTQIAAMSNHACLEFWRKTKTVA